MSDFYDSLANTSQRLIEDKGQTLIITRKTTSAYNPVTRAISQSSSTANVTGIALPLSSHGDDARIAGTVIGKEVIKFLIAAKDAQVIPDKGDLVSFDSKKWEVISLTRISPAGTDLIYKVYGVV